MLAACRNAGLVMDFFQSTKLRAIQTADSSYTNIRSPKKNTIPQETIDRRPTSAHLTMTRGVPLTTLILRNVVSTHEPSETSTVSALPPVSSAVQPYASPLGTFALTVVNRRTVAASKPLSAKVLDKEMSLKSFTRSLE